MTFPRTLGAIVVLAIEIILIFGGLGLLWHLQLSGEARAKLQAPRPLARWNISLTMFIQLGICVVCAALGFQLAFAQFLKHFLPSIANDPDQWKLLVGSSAHIGALLGLLIARLLPDIFDPLPPEVAAATPSVSKLPLNKVPLGGLATLATLMPLMTATAWLWQKLLTSLKIPIEQQDLIDIFNNAESRWEIAGMIFFAVVVAPLTEELIFRAGLFRFLRGRVPRWVAFCVPNALFAAAHELNVTTLLPLFVLGVVFSIAYERTGRILVPILAHGLFNLNTIVVLLTGLNS